MRCQFCQQPISLLRRLSDAEFCSVKHREQYEQRESTLAIARLQPLARKAGGRRQNTFAAPMTVAVLEPPASRHSATLAGTVPCPPKPTRSYWCFALPAEPITPPLGVMLRDSPARWTNPSPAWATSVVALWPVDQRRQPKQQASLPPTQVAFVLPASPLDPLPWFTPATSSISRAFASLIPLRILPAWSLPLGRPGDSASEAFPIGVLRPSVTAGGRAALAIAPALELAPLDPVRLALVSPLWPVEPLSPAVSPPSLQIGATALANTDAALQQEWQGYVQRMERQLVEVAEQSGLCDRVPSIAPALRAPSADVPKASADVRFEICRSLPGAFGTFAAPAPPWGTALPVSSPAALTLEIGPKTTGQSPLLSPLGLQWPIPPARLGRSLSWGQFVAPDSILPGVRTWRAAIGVTEPVPSITPCWPTSLPALPALAKGAGLVRPPEPMAKPALALWGGPEAVLAPPSLSMLIRSAPAVNITPTLASLVPVDHPEFRPSASTAGAELNLLPARPSVIVPPSAGAVWRRSSTHQPTLFPLSALFPTRRDQAPQDARLEICPWRAKPVLPPTRLPRISLQERNATRARALKEVGQALQQETIERAKRFWKLAPADLKWLALALPIVMLGVWLWPGKTVSVSVASPIGLMKTAAKPAAGSSYLEKVWQSDLNLGGFEERIASRSSILLEEDFSAGLGLWEGEGNWARSWYYDKGGVVRPGRMAIYQPSIPMKDYQLELTAAVERRSISWMVRASNLRNYIAVRLNIVGSGANQRLSFERWTVKEGRVTRRQVLPLATNLGSATTARIRMDVVGNTFTTVLQDQVIDVFTDSSHASGGVGLFSSVGDQPRIYRLDLSHQHDFFGRLCSFLAPHPITKAGTIRP